MTLVDVLGTSTHDFYVRRWGDGRPHRRLASWPLVFQTYEQLLRRLRTDTGDLGYWHNLEQDLALLQASIWMTPGLCFPPSPPSRSKTDRRIRGNGKLWAKLGEEQFQIFAIRQDVEIDDEETEPTVKVAFREAKKSIRPSSVEVASFQVAIAFCPWKLDASRGEHLEEWVEEHREREPRPLDRIFEVGLRVDIAPMTLSRSAVENEGWLYPGMTIVLGFQPLN